MTEDELRTKKLAEAIKKMNEALPLLSDAGFPDEECMLGDILTKLECSMEYYERSK